MLFANRQAEEWNLRRYFSWTFCSIFDSICFYSVESDQPINLDKMADETLLRVQFIYARYNNLVQPGYSILIGSCIFNNSITTMFHEARQESCLGSFIILANNSILEMNCLQTAVNNDTNSTSFFPLHHF